MNYDVVYAWRVVGIVAVILILSVTTCNIHQNHTGGQAVKEMVLEGADPMCAYCSVWGAGENNPEMAIICLECAKKESNAD